MRDRPKLQGVFCKPDLHNQTLRCTQLWQQGHLRTAQLQRLIVHVGLAGRPGYCGDRFFRAAAGGSFCSKFDSRGGGR